MYTRSRNSSRVAVSNSCAHVRSLFLRDPYSAYGSLRSAMCRPGKTVEADARAVLGLSSGKVPVMRCLVTRTASRGIKLGCFF